MFTRTVVISCLVGLALVISFVPWALRRANIHPLVQLRLFTNRYMTIAVITMTLFAMAFFGASLLFTLYFQQVRGESPLSSGWLVAPQGFGAMLDDARRRVPRRQDRPREGGADRPRPRHGRHGDADRRRRHHVVPLHHHRVRGHGPRHGVDDDAGLHRGAGQPEGARRRPRLDPDEHHPADRDLGGHGDVQRAAHECLQRARLGGRAHARDPERRPRPGQAAGRAHPAPPDAGPGAADHRPGAPLHGQRLRPDVPRRHGPRRSLPGPGVLPAAQADRSPSRRPP